MIKYFMVIMLCLTVVGCQSTKRVIVESEYIRAVMRTGAPVETIKSVKLTDIELIKLTRSANVYADFADKWRSPADALKHGGDELKEDYIKLKDHYVMAYRIARDHWLDYPMSDRDQMREWHNHAVKFDEAALDYMKLEKYVDMAAEAVAYARMGAVILIGVATQ